MVADRDDSGLEKAFIPSILDCKEIKPPVTAFHIRQKPLEECSAHEKLLLDGIRRHKRPSKKALLEDSELSVPDFNTALDALIEGRLVVCLHSYEHPFVLSLLIP